MSRVFLISDLHFGHENMAKKRGFNSALDHDLHIIKQWNLVVNKRDIVWILGDITMEDPKFYYLLDELNGSKRVILGNHDLPKHSKQLLKYVDFVGGITRYKKCWLTHCPVHPRELDFRVEINIHGHLHEDNIYDFIPHPNIPGHYICDLDKRYINVSCEQVNYTPQLFTDLVKNLR